MGTFQQTEANCLQPIIVMRVLSLLAIVGLCHGKSIIGGNGVTLLRSLNLTETRDKASSQTLTCYDYSGGGGDSVRAIDYIPALRNYNFDNRIGSCCFTGTWILYGEENYNSYNTGAANWWAYGDNYCLDVPAAFDNQASSLRFTGAPDDWKYDTLNLFFNDYFIGDEEFTYNDMTQLNYDNRARSIIVTGCSAWTVYQYDNYQGQAACMFPADSSQCSPGFYPTSASLGSLASDISSVRRGCYAKEKVYPVNHMGSMARGTRGGSGASGFFMQN